MLQDDLQRTFPANAIVPPALAALARYQEGATDFFSGHFEVTATDAAVYWFDGDAQAASQFAVFGQGPDGSLIAFWLYAQKPPSEAPVVFLGSEGCFNKLLATDFHDFLCLLSLGYSEFIFLDDCSQPPEPSSSLQAFRHWLRTQFGIVPPPDASALLRRAIAEHPDLDAWITSWSERRGDRVGPSE